MWGFAVPNPLFSMALFLAPQIEKGNRLTILPALELRVSDLLRFQDAHIFQLGDEGVEIFLGVKRAVHKQRQLAIDVLGDVPS